MVEVIYGDASNLTLTAQKRLVRVVYGQTQVTPYAGLLDPNLRSETGGLGSIVVPGATATKPFKRSEAVATLKNSIMPGTVLVKSEGEYLAPAAGVKGERPFGLLGQWLGGEFDGVKGSNQLSAWYGPGAVIDVLKPAFNEKPKTSGISSETISALLATAKTELETGTEAANQKARIVVVADTNGLLSAGTQKKAEVEEKFVPFAEVVELVNANVLRIKLLV